jgi:hypothetical protein
VKYKASVRVIGWVKLTADVRSITKYVAAKMSRKKGNASPSTSAAFTAGKGEPIMVLSCHPVMPTKTTRPISTRTTVLVPSGWSRGST